MSHHEFVTILLVEDDPGHKRLIEKNLQRANFLNPIVALNNGQEALDYIFNQVDSTGRISQPMLILLDLNMPIIDGFQVLEKIKANEATKHIPVIILTSTDEPRDINRCYKLGCNVYITKPVEYDAFVSAVQRLGLFLAVTAVPRVREL